MASLTAGVAAFSVIRDSYYICPSLSPFVSGASSHPRIAPHLLLIIAIP
jgi:hypothetical protein